MRCRHPIDVSVRSGSERFYVRGVPYYGRASFIVPCGKCLACKKRKQSEMVFRMDCERMHGHLDKNGEVCRYKYCFFITLTYAPRFLPRWVPTRYDLRTGEVFDFVEVSPEHSGLLNPLHFGEFMKRLRRYYGLDCKVFGCGEYGDAGDRPHMHLILYSNFNWQETKDACRHAWSMKCPTELRNTPGSFLVKGKYNTWRFVFGRVDVKPVNIRRMRYCAKYIVKDTDSLKEIPKFARVSHQLGSAWLLTSEARSVRANKRLFAYTHDGKPSSIGRYFTHRIFTREQLTVCIDAFIDEFESPPDGCETGEFYRRWYDEHIAQNNSLFRASLARKFIPKLSYV